MVEWLGPLAVGLLGSGHCLGMCGPLVLAYSVHLGGMPRAPTGSPLRGFCHHLAFHLGRIATYGLLGALAALAFRAFGPALALARARAVLSVLGGGAMVYLGFALLRLAPASGCGATTSLWSRLASRLLRSPRLLSRAALGGAVGFLPCCFTWAMLAQAATTWNPARGFLTMVAFGLGTTPALLFPGLCASVLTARTRLAGQRAGALGVVVMGGILLVKGASALA